MPVPRIVRGQRVEEAKMILAKQLRREMTPAERLLWERLRRSQLNGYHFRRQQVVHGFVADFYCQAAALIVELDGEAHAGREGYDAERDRILSDLGVLSVRFDNEAVCGQTDGVLKAISESCAQRIAANKVS
jgi:very-short-patch-repair endonuclease